MTSKTNKRSWNSSAFSLQSKHETGRQAKKSDQVKESNDIEIGEAAKIGGKNMKVSEVIGTPTVNSSNWAEIFEPSKSDEVAVHPKKIEELKQWFMHCESIRKKHPAQICLLTGPSGCGKTAAVRVLAQSMKYELQEWINPVDREVITTLGDQSNTYLGSQLELFKSFLFRSSRYKSLMGPQNRLVLVEDFPNVIISNPESFEDILDDYLKYGKSPLLFIVTDSKRRAINISYNLFTEQLKNKFNINHISFNLIASTLLQKAVKRFCNIMKEPPIAESYTVPSQAVIDSIVFAAQGDIRNALINLHFAALKGTCALPLERVQSCESKGKSRKQTSTLKTIRRDESVTMMHALGRVFNPKRLSNGNFMHTPEDISESFASEPKRFVDLMHANYLPHFSDIEHIVEAANALSATDIIINEYREEVLAPMALNIAVRSIMVTNKKPVSAWIPIRAQNRYQMNLDKSQCYKEGVSLNLFATDYSSFVKIINGSNRSQTCNS